MSDNRDTDEEQAPPEPETGEGKFVFPNGAVYGKKWTPALTRGMTDSRYHIVFRLIANQ